MSAFKSEPGDPLLRNAEKLGEKTDEPNMMDTILLNRVKEAKKDPNTKDAIAEKGVLKTLVDLQDPLQSVMHVKETAKELPYTRFMGQISRNPHADFQANQVTFAPVSWYRSFGSGLN